MSDSTAAPPPPSVTVIRADLLVPILRDILFQLDHVAEVAGVFNRFDCLIGARCDLHDLIAEVSE